MAKCDEFLNKQCSCVNGARNIQDYYKIDKSSQYTDFGYCDIP